MKAKFSKEFKKSCNKFVLEFEKRIPKLIEQLNSEILELKTQIKDNNDFLLEENGFSTGGDLLQAAQMTLNELKVKCETLRKSLLKILEIGSTIKEKIAKPLVDEISGAVVALDIRENMQWMQKIYHTAMQCRCNEIEVKSLNDLIESV